MDVVAAFKHRIKPLLYFLGVAACKAAWRKLQHPSHLYILMYHRIDLRPEPYYERTVGPNIFEHQVRLLKRRFTIIDFDDLQNLNERNDQKKDFLILTFDDGYKDNYRYAFPVLKKYNVPATIFVTTGLVGTNDMLWFDKLAWILHTTPLEDEAYFSTCRKYAGHPVGGEKKRLRRHVRTVNGITRNIGRRMREKADAEKETLLNRMADDFKLESWPTAANRPMLSWQEIKEMSEYGISFGSHTVHHPILSRLSRSQANAEIVESKIMLESITDKPVQTFAYPYGKKKDYNGREVEMVRQAGFKYACSAIRGIERLPLKLTMELKRRGVPDSPYLFL